MFYSVDETAELLGMSPAYIRKMLKQKQMAHIKFPGNGPGGRPTITIAANQILEFIDKNTEYAI